MTDSSKKSEKILTNPLSGFMELLPAEQIVFNRMYHTIQKSYEMFGFSPLDTPVLERAEVLLAKAGGDTEKQIYRFTKGDTDLAMRFDLTVPLARFVANNYSRLTFPYRRYALGKIYRGERPQAGRFREFYQCDIDVIGDGTLSLQYDAELPSIIYTIFSELGLGDFTIRINNRKILGGFFEAIAMQERATEIMQCIDRLDKIGTAGVKTLLEEMQIPASAVEQIFTFINLSGSNDAILDGLRSLPVRSTLLQEGIAELSEVMSLIRQLGVPEKFFAIDLSIARGLDYYTGTVYETRLDAYPEIGSVCSGGRYEDLASHYTDKKLPGVGMSIGLTRLFDQLMRREVIRAEASTPTKVLVIPLMEDLGPSLSLATTLRKAGIPTEVSFIQGKMDKKLKYATKLGIPYAAFVGESEVAKGAYTFKDLTKRTQIEADTTAIISLLQD